MGAKSALPSPTDNIAIEVEPAQQDNLIGEHHQHQPQWRVTWTDKRWQNRSKDRASLGLKRLFSSPCLKATHSPRCLTWGAGVVTSACLFLLKLAIRLRRPRYPQVCCPGELPDGEGDHRSLQQDRDAQHRCKRPDDASAPMPRVVKEAARLPARSAWRVTRAVSGPGVTISSAATTRKAPNLASKKPISDPLQCW